MEEAAKAADEAHKKDMKARAKAEDLAREEHAIALELKYEQELENAIDEQKKLF